MNKNVIKKLKFGVIFIFVFPVLIIYSGIFDTKNVSGQTGGATLDAPTGVIASDDAYSTKVWLHWDTIRGATTYRIFRNTVNDSSNATDVGSTQANYFYDTTADQNQTYFYFVRAENASQQSNFSQSDQGRRANGTVGGGIQPLQPPPAPPGNPVTAAKATLGKILFWDEQLSSTDTVACGTCHTGSGGGVDKRTALQRTRSDNPGPDGILNNGDDIFGSPGVIANNLDGTLDWSDRYGFNEQVTGRRAMPYTDAAYPPSLFWDGRATPTFRDPITNQIILQNGAALESQALGPPISDAEMAHSGRNWQQTADKMTNVKPLALAANIPQGLTNWIDGRSYPELFQEAFGTPEVTPTRIAMAIATHERTLFSDQTPFDQVLQGIGTLTTAEQNGRNLFNSPATQCNTCHLGNLLTDNQFHNIGVRPQTDDTGRFQVTNNQGNSGEFRTPNLRNVELRDAYFHNGRFTTIREVVDFYARGGDFDAPNHAPNVRPRNLNNQQRNDIVAFLSRPMTDPRVRDELPPFDHPTLYSETDRVPTVSGTGRAGTGGNVPQVRAIEPPMVGNPSFTVGVTNALPNTQAVLVIGNSDPGVGTTIPTNGSFARETVTLSNTGTGNGYGSVSLAIPNNQNLVGQTFFGRWYVNDAAATNGFSVSQVFQFTVFGEGANVVNSDTRFDFDGDSKTDVSIFRPSNGQWWFLRSSDGNNSAVEFGNASDKIVPADYTGDGKTDVAFFRPSSGEWFILRSEDNTFFAFPFGNSTDIPASGDFDADGQDDVAVFRPATGTWFIQASTNGTIIQNFGTNGDIPQVGDYDGDGKADIAIYRPNGTSSGEWWINRSSGGVSAFQFGSSTDKPVASDFTGDGKIDAAFWRESTGEWFVLRSEDLSYFAVPFGSFGDTPAVGDYDGDGRYDLAVFRQSEGNWYINGSTSGIITRSFGINGDKAVPSAYIP